MQSYRLAAEVRLDPYGLRSPDFPAQAEPADPRADLLVMVGDSRAYRWPSPAGYRVVNRGVPDQSTEQIRGRFAEHVLALRPRVVVLQAGINDLKAIGVLPTRHDAIVARCTENLRAMVYSARDSGAKVVLSTIFPPGDVSLARRPVWSEAIAAAVIEVNAELRTLRSEGVEVLDAWALLEDGHGRARPEMQLDTLHLSDEGYRVVGAELARLLTL